MGGLPLQKINLTQFWYRPFVGKREKLTDLGRHTGTYDVEYGDPVEYEGQITIPYGTATARMFGLDANYTHVLTMEDPETDITEHGQIEWKGDIYDITAVRPSLNCLTVGLRKRTKNVLKAGGD